MNTYPISLPEAKEDLLRLLTQRIIEETREAAAKSSANLAIMRQSVEADLLVVHRLFKPVPTFRWGNGSLCVRADYTLTNFVRRKTKTKIRAYMAAEAAWRKEFGWLNDPHDIFMRQAERLALDRLNAALVAFQEAA